ncbi:MAG: xanthine dehydrogenase family protein [Spirochaetaceae bacterium]|nr:xanthine dehydrogenase family protein [Spirochaetaceae bacterium]
MAPRGEAAAGPDPGAAGLQARELILGDLSQPGMVHVATIRSPTACGRLVSVKAPTLPKGYRLILPADIPGENRIVSFGAELPVLAAERVTYVGEPVALLAGPDLATLGDLAESTRVLVEEEEGTFSWKSFASEQVVAKRVAVIGDPELAFSIADKVLEGEYDSGALEHLYSEPQGALAAFDYDKMAIWCATQWPYHVRDCVALVLGGAGEDVVVRPTRLGFHLDGKLWYPSLLACHAALAALLCKKPARILLSREEDFRCTTKRARSSVSLRTGLDATGRLTALDFRISLNVGAFGPLAEEMLSQACVAATGAYSCPNVRIEGYAVTTNTPPLGAFAGLGAAPSFFALESEAARLASAAGQDPVSWKSRNVLRKGSSLVTGDPLKEEPPYEEIAGRLGKASDFGRKWACYELVRKRRAGRDDGPLRGIGFAFAYQGAGAFLSGGAPNSYSVEATLDKELRLSLKTSAAACSGTMIDLWRRSASDLLGLPLEEVSVAPPDTDLSPNSGPVTLSRGLTVVNKLVERACQAIQKRRFRDPLPISAKAVYRIAKPLHWENGRIEGSIFETAAWGGAVVEVELDPWTLEPKPLGLWLCADGGRIVAPSRARAALRSGAATALSASMRESLEFAADGAIGAEYYRYGILPPGELPPIHVEILEADRRAPAKGLGELPNDTVPAAFMAAVAQAAGANFQSLPVGPEALADWEET